MRLSKRLAAVSTLALCAVSLHGQAQGQGRPPPPPGAFGGEPVMNTLREGKLYWGLAGATVGYVIGDKGVIMIDNGYPQASGAIKAITDKPITTVIETHDDTDHINGLYNTPNAQNLKIIAMEDNWKQQWTSFKWTEKPKANCPQSPMPPAPNVIIREPRVETTIDGVKFVLHHFGPSHTGHDLIVELPEYKVAFIGDTVMDTDLFPNHPGLPPQDHGMFWKSEKRGTPRGFFHTVDELLKLDVDTFVSGHGDKTLTKADLRRKRDEIKATYEKQAAMVKAGMSLEELRKAVGNDKYAPRGGCIEYVDLPWYVFTETKRDMQELKNGGSLGY